MNLAGMVLEQGALVPEKNQPKCVYLTRTRVASGQTVAIQDLATDRPGNTSSKLFRGLHRALSRRLCRKLAGIRRSDRRSARRRFRIWGFWDRLQLAVPAAGFRGLHRALSRRHCRKMAGTRQSARRSDRRSDRRRFRIWGSWDRLQLAVSAAGFRGLHRALSRRLCRKLAGTRRSARRSDRRSARRRFRIWGNARKSHATGWPEEGVTVDHEHDHAHDHAHDLTLLPSPGE
jgi:hypothetical protein